MSRRAVMVVMDGLGDRPLPEFEGRTALEAAETPNMDRLAAEGVNGLMDPLAPGVRVGTDVGHLALFGYNPLRVYWGRGPIEAAGVGLDLRPGDVAFRANFATVSTDGRILDRRAGRLREGTAELAAALDSMLLSDGTRVVFRAATEHRAVLVLRGERLSPLVSDSDPGPLGEGGPVLPLLPRMEESQAARRTAELASEFVERAAGILAEHPVNRERVDRGLPPANYVLLRGAGVRRPMRSLAERFNISGACVAAECTIVGIARMTGFDVVTDERFTANLDTDVDAKAAAAVDALEEHDLVIIHYKGTDIASHDEKPKEKVRFIERVDAALERLISAAERYDLYIAVTSDHSTPCHLREHSADPVPVLLWGGDVLTDGVRSYGERPCVAGGLGRLSANALLLTLLDYLGVTYRFGG